VETCRICGARLFDGLAHCARCLAPVEPTEAEIAEAMIDVAAVAGRWQPPRPAAQGRRSDQPDTFTRREKVHSRWRPGVLSFSLPVKIAITVGVVLGVPFLAYTISGPLAIGPILIWSITVTPRALRDLWRRTRVA
jgi:hypothetical protein